MKCFYRRAATWMLAAIAAVGVASGARAQQKTLTVAVLPFSNASGQAGALVTKTAAAAVETQLMDSGRYDVVKRDLVEKTLTDLSLTFPLGRTGTMQLAQALEADGIVSGEVLKVSKVAKTNQVRVQMRVEMTDRSSGELSNGAIVTGESGVRPDFSGSEDVLVDEAVNKAAFAAVRSMTERILPEGTVFATSTREGQIEALLNIGTNSGVRHGMEFIVLRNKEQVGRIRVTSTTPTDSTAAVVSTTRGVQPEDKVRAVFRLENIPVEQGGSGASTSKIVRPKMNLGGVAMGALALLGLTKVSHGSFSEGRSARNLRAVASGPFNGAPVPDTVPNVPVIHITWAPPAGVVQSDIIGYAIFREDQRTHTGSPIFIAGRGEREYYDTGRALVIEANDDLQTEEGSVDGLAAGVPTRYRIRMAYNKTTTDSSSSSSSSSSSTTVELAEEVVSVSATPILPPPAVSATASDLTAVTFNFKQVPGADRFVVQVANNPNFTNADTYPKSGEGISLVASPDPVLPIGYNGTLSDSTDGSAKVCTWDPEGTDCMGFWDPRTTTDGTTATYCPDAKLGPVNLMTGNVDPTAGTLYWRVGARNSRDDIMPENGGWVWGTFQVLSRSAAVSTKPIYSLRPPVANIHPVDADSPASAGSVTGPASGASHSRTGRN